jgi:hypothetical protein
MDSTPLTPPTGNAPVFNRDVKAKTTQAGDVERMLSLLHEIYDVK